MSITWVGTILIIENSLSELELLSNYLENKGYKIITATTAREALEIALEEKPDAIVTDVVMPGMSGFELCQFLKNHPIYQKVPMVICSVKNQSIQHFWARKQGADACINKPYTPEELLSAIQSVEV
ncbi:response regulator [Nostoc sp. CENA67]|uniref:Response regulator n=1 Tax=Amazonocrinis nigriterrae CENA67 TaxID=2794033 RepID=A0A8J7LBV1_9NOST|nr:response regulator [Amazonocrinis nigriterrae]MBH8565801.1 response regulator [Amazonocrinis nigriterrae CENA67]